MDVRTAEHDCEMMRVMVASGMDKVLPEPNEQWELYLARLSTAAILSGMACDIVASVLIPADKNESDWTPELGADTTAFMKSLNTEEDRTQIRDLAAAAAMGFFLRELNSLANSLSSLERVTANGAGSSNAVAST